jgi:hypothetical protein
VMGVRPSGSDTTTPVIPEAEPLARLSGTLRGESSLPRSRHEAPLVFARIGFAKDDTEHP